MKKLKKLKLVVQKDAQGLFDSRISQASMHLLAGGINAIPASTTTLPPDYVSCSKTIYIQSYSSNM